MKKSNCYLSIFLNTSHGSKQTYDAHILCLAYRHVVIIEWYYAILKDGISVSRGQTWQASISFHRHLELSSSTVSSTECSSCLYQQWKVLEQPQQSATSEIFITTSEIKNKTHLFRAICAQLYNLSQRDVIWMPSIIPGRFLIIKKGRKKIKMKISLQS